MRAQYVKKFGRFGQAVVESNMQVMTQGGERLVEVTYGDLGAPDRSQMRGEVLIPNVDSSGDCGPLGCTPKPARQEERIPMYKTETFNTEYRSGLGYNQPASPLASVGVMAAASGATASKYGAAGKHRSS